MKNYYKIKKLKKQELFSALHKQCERKTTFKVTGVCFVYCTNTFRRFVTVIDTKALSLLVF